MVYKLTYQRPPLARSPRDSLSGDEKQSSINESIASSTTSSITNGIPEALSFDKIVAGGTCPPCTVRDFLNYLKYIEHAAENLQFYLWYRDYSARFEKLPQNEQALSPIWSRAQADAAESPTYTNSHRISKLVSPGVAKVFQATEFADPPKQIAAHKIDPFASPNGSLSIDEKRDGASEYSSTNGDAKTMGSSTTQRSMADSAFDEAGLKWKPFTTQPYRDEIARVINTYLTRDSSRELNMSDRERGSALRALQVTTHPSALRSIATSVEYTLRRQAHPNFIRWTICNGNRPRVIFARGLGISLILFGFLADLLITLSSVSRAWRVLPFLGWFLGISTLIAAWKGMCVVLHGMHHRHLRPWELFADDELDAGPDEKRTSEDSLLSSSTNSFEDEPWIARYGKRNVIRKIFDREIWIEEPALRGIQDTIFLQSLLGAFVASAIVVGIFCAVPKGNFY